MPDPVEAPKRARGDRVSWQHHPRAGTVGYWREVAKACKASRRSLRKGSGNMMLVPTFLDKSPIHGVGIFASSAIPQGTRVWEFTENADQVFSESGLAALLPLQRETVLFYGYVEPGREGVVLCCDNARHFNLLRDANCGAGEHSAHGYISTFALRDIAAGEELTYPFEEDDDARRKLGEAEFPRQSSAG